MLSNPSITSNRFFGNSADAFAGGGICNVTGDLSLSNCTFTGNSADVGGGLFNADCIVSLTNSILWDNTAVAGGNGIVWKNHSERIYRRSLGH